MVSQSSRSETYRWDCFDSLPPELSCKIFDYLSLEDIHSLVTASPAARFYFYANHGHVLRFHLEHLWDYYGDEACIRLAIIAMRLRSIRAKCRGQTVLQTEKQVKPVLESILLLDFNQPHSGWERDFPGLIIAKNLIPELRDAWSVYRHEYSCLYLRPVNWPTQALGNIPRATSRKFVEGFLRFDCYCNIFYLNRGFLFQHMAHIRRIFFQPFSSDSVIDNHLELDLGRGRVYYYTIVNHVQNSHRVLLRIVHQSLWPSRTPPANASLERDGGTERLQAIRFLRRTDNEEDYYLHHLCMQGYPRLLFLQQLSRQALQNYTIHSFSEIVVARPQWHIKWPELEHYRALVWQWG